MLVDLRSLGSSVTIAKALLMMLISEKVSDLLTKADGTRSLLDETEKSDRKKSNVRPLMFWFHLVGTSLTRPSDGLAKCNANNEVPNTNPIL